VRALASWDWGFESLRGYGCLSHVGVVFCQVQVSASGLSLIQRSPKECGVPECDREASAMRRPWPNTGCCARCTRELASNFGIPKPLFYAIQ